MTFLVAALAIFALQGQPDASVKVKLARIYKADESQAYTGWATTTAGDADMKIEASFTRTTKEASADGAKVETKYSSAKMTFAGDSMDVDELPDPKTEDFTAVGLQKTIDLTGEGPLDFLSPLFFVPNSEVTLGATFPVKWKSEEGTLSLEGEGRLLATGMLYEEHVAKIEMNLQLTPKDGSAATYKYMSYLNLDSGKLVKAEGTFSTDDEDNGKVEMKFDLSKVRSK